MPIYKNDNRDDPKYKSSAFCCFCGDFVGNCSDEFLKYSGYAVDEPKFNITCKKCFSHGWENNWAHNCLVKGIGPMEVQVQNAGEVSKKGRKPSKPKSEINWPTIDSLIEAGTCKLNQVAPSLGMTPNDLKLAMATHYGERIEFRRGRTGGVYWSKKGN